MRRVFLLLLLLGGCETCSVANQDTCDSVPRGGSCSSDDECTLAFCASACCESPEPCGAPMPFRKSALDDHECLYAQGHAPTGVCRKSTDCLCDTCEPPPMEARCVDGQCAAVIVDGGAQ